MAMEPERARRFRRRIWAAAFFLALGILVWQTFSKTESIKCTIVLELGPRAADVRSLEGELLIDDDEVAGTFARNAPVGTPRFTVTVPQKAITVQVRIHLPDRVVQARRPITAQDDATIYVPLARELE